MSLEYPINKYTCANGHSTHTKDIDSGVTPYLVPCKKFGNDCCELARSSFYDERLTIQFKLGDIKPTHEWYSPGKNEKARLTRWEKQHVEQGGLLIREIK